MSGEVLYIPKVVWMLGSDVQNCNINVNRMGMDGDDVS